MAEARFIGFEEEITVPGGNWLLLSVYHMLDLILNSFIYYLVLIFIKAFKTKKYYMHFYR